MTEQKSKFNIKYLLGISLVSALGGLLFGYDLVVIGGAKEFYELTFNLSSAAIKGWAVSSCIVGCIIGAMGVGKPSDAFGRKKLLIISSIMFLISAIGSGYAPNFTQFVLYRLLGGIGMGIASTLSPMYIAEVSPAKYRGRFVSLNQMTIVIGILLAQMVNFAILQSHQISDEISNGRLISAIIEQKIIDLNKDEGGNAASMPTKDTFSPEQMEWIKSGKYLESLNPEIADADAINAELQKDIADISVLRSATLREHYDMQLMETWNGQTGWRWMFVAEAIPALLFCLFMFLVPNSPRWLCRVGKVEKARRVMEKIGGAEYADESLASITKTFDDTSTHHEFAQLLKPKMARILLIGVVLAIFQQWCGINIVFSYAHDIFKAAGYGVDGVLFNLVIIGLTNFIFTLVAMATVDKLGRKVLILWGSAGLAISYIVVGTCFHLQIQGVVVLIAVLGAIACFSATLGPVMWVLISEIFPNRVRGLATSIAVLSLWVANFILQSTFPIIKEAFSIAATFWLYAGICVLGVIFIKLFIPETKGKTLEEIESSLSVELK
ncbi:MAG: sugar porter family MFS transporter [Desulfobulbaceae bacterium]|nr:sugar porter family MFS transporter [Desulfobulbaceae bacterium]